MWILTKSYNQYDQYGDYFVAAFLIKPTTEELDVIIQGAPVDYLNHLLSGGGRVDTEDDWYHLVEVNHGEVYKHRN